MGQIVNVATNGGPPGTIQLPPSSAQQPLRDDGSAGGPLSMSGSLAMNGNSVSLNGGILYLGLSSVYLYNSGGTIYESATAHNSSFASAASSGSNYGLQITNTLSQSGTAAFTDLSINRTGTPGGGAQLLLNLAVSGSSKFSVDTSGNGTFAGYTVQNQSQASYFTDYTNGAAYVATNAGGGYCWVHTNRLTGSVGFSIKQASGQTADSFRVLNSSGTELFALDVNGRIVMVKNSAPSTLSGFGQLYTDSGGNLYYLSPGGTSTKLASN